MKSVWLFEENALFSHCFDAPDEPDFFWDHEEDWESALKEEAERISNQKAAEKRADLKEDETLDAKHSKCERDAASEIADLEFELKKLKDPRAIERTEKRLATLREIEAAEPKRPLRYE